MIKVKRECNIDDLVKWIDTNIDVDGWIPQQKALYWFVSMEEARNVTEYDVTDLANLFLDGIPQMSVDQVTEYLDTIYECCEIPEDYTEVNETLLNCLNNHFSIESTKLF